MPFFLLATNSCLLKKGGDNLDQKKTEKACYTFKCFLKPSMLSRGKCFRFMKRSGGRHPGGEDCVLGGCNSHLITCRNALYLYFTYYFYNETVDGSEIRRAPVDLVVYPILYMVLAPSQVVSRISEPSTVWNLPFATILHKQN